MAEEMGYRPNVIAQGLKRKGTKTIALVVPDITNPFFITVAIGVQERIRAFGYHYDPGQHESEPGNRG